MFKKNFIKLCASRNVTATTVCEAVGITISAFSQWTDKTVPRQTTLQKIADYFGVTPEYLLQDNSEVSQERNEKEQAILEQYNELTDEEKEKAREYIKFLISQRK